MPCNPAMVRPDERRASVSGRCLSRCIQLAGEGPARVSAGAPGSRPRFVGEIRRAERGVESLLLGGSKGAGRNRKVNAAASSDYQPKGEREGRAAHVTAKATDTVLGPDRTVDLLGVLAAARIDSWVRNRRGPPRWPHVGQAVRIRTRPKSSRCREGVRGAHSTDESVETRWREGALLWSC